MPNRLAEFERQHRKKALYDKSFWDALAIFESLWSEAHAASPDFGEERRSDIEPGSPES